MICKIREKKDTQQYFENGEWITCSSSVFLGYYYQWLMNKFKSKDQVHDEDGFCVFETELSMGSEQPYPEFLND